MRWQQEISRQITEEPESIGKIAKRLVLLALPVSCANIMVPVTSSIDMLLVPNRLVESGFSVEEATTLFGYLTGMGMPLVMMATIPTLSLTASLVPAVSEAFTLGDRNSIDQKTNMAMKLCCLLTFPAAAGMWALAQPISKLLYGTPLAGEAIRNLAPSICLLGIHQITTGMLQEWDRLLFLCGICCSARWSKLLLFGILRRCHAILSVPPGPLTLILAWQPL